MSSDRPEDHPERWQELMRLLRPFHEAAARTARRLTRSVDDGDDLLSEAILRAFDRLPTLRDPERFRSWFFAVLMSVHRNRARRSFWKRFLSLEGQRSQGFEPAGPDGTREAELARRADRAARALATLNAEQREAIVLFELEGFSIEEIAEVEEVGISAIKSRLARGRERLRRCYERWENHGESNARERGAGRRGEQHHAGPPPLERRRLVAD